MLEILRFTAFGAGIVVYLWILIRAPRQWMRACAGLVVLSGLGGAVALGSVQLSSAGGFALAWAGILPLVFGIKPIGTFTWTDPATATVHRVNLVRMTMEVRQPTAEGQPPTLYLLRREGTQWMLLLLPGSDAAWRPVEPHALAEAMAVAHRRLGVWRQQYTPGKYY